MVPWSLCEFHYTLRLSSFTPTLIPAILALSRSTMCTRFMLISHNVKGSWAFGLVLLPFISSWTGHCLGKSSCLSSPLGFHFYYSFSSHAHGLVGCFSYHVGPLDLLPPLLDFPDLFTLRLPLIVPISLLIVIPAMLAHRVYCPFFGFPRPIYFTFTSYNFHGPASCHSCHVSPLGLLPLFLGFLDSFTSLWPIGYHSCHVDPLGLLPYFYHLYSFFLSFSLLLGFFCHWAFCQKWAPIVV